MNKIKSVTLCLYTLKHVEIDKPSFQGYGMYNTNSPSTFPAGQTDIMET